MQQKTQTDFEYKEKLRKDFYEKKYAYLEDFLDAETARDLTEALKMCVEQGLTQKDDQCPLSEGVYAAPVFEQLLSTLCPSFEQATGKRLLPTYSYARLYKPGEELINHTDRPSCEISATLTLGFEGDPWPIYFGNKDKSEQTSIKMKAGDAVIYQGERINHWREKYTEGLWQAQVFLHYVDANGPNYSYIYDRRPELGLPRPDYRVWTYEDILTDKACKIIIDTYTNEMLEKEQAGVGGGTIGTIDLNIRNVKKLLLPTFKDIGGRLAAIGLDANSTVWKFDITRCNQAEFLIYDVEGRYTAHTDTFVNPESPECRKLTVLAFLNDDFEGGRFFIQDGKEKMYPLQKPGTVIVFPSWMVHGVEDVTKGTRYSVVAWMVGPWFK
jgi:predicted 2-oxoglutarate/Fe(II)-dependent dioxygenase YbiX